jgi:hypothetical protein
MPWLLLAALAVIDVSTVKVGRPTTVTELDQHTHKQVAPGVKNALLPAWSTDGARLAWVQKSGRRKYTRLWSTLT